MDVTQRNEDHGDQFIILSTTPSLCNDGVVCLSVACDLQLHISLAGVRKKCLV